MAPMLFTDAILNDRPIKVFNNGEMSRDFTYIDDTVDGIIKVIDNSKLKIQYSKLFNIGQNAPLSLMTFIETIGKKAIKNFMPMQDGDVVSTYADVSGLIIKLADGIGEFVKWYREFYGK
jgi:UDP-glucuronate 4-epimerase